jgi:hypothetical protein
MALAVVARGGRSCALRLPPPPPEQSLADATLPFVEEMQR